MIFGDPAHERLQHNEETVWAGGPVDNNNPAARSMEFVADFLVPALRRGMIEVETRPGQEIVYSTMISSAKSQARPPAP